MRSIFALWPLLVAAQSVPPVYTIHPFAGTAWTGDGRAATSAVLIQPSGIALDAAGNIYISDARDHRIRCVARDGSIRTVAGTGNAGLKPDMDVATASPLNSPYGLAADSAGSVYIADLGNALVRRLGTDGRLVTIAGGGTQAPSLAPTKAASVKLGQPRDVAVDRYGNVFISDFATHQVYQMTPDGSLMVLAGTGKAGAITGRTAPQIAALSSPAGLAVDAAGTLYIADSGNRRVRRLSGGWMTTLLDAAGKEIELGPATGIAVDSGNRVYIADGGTRLTVVWPNGEFLSLGIAGTAVALGPGGDVFTILDRQVLRLTGGSTAVVAGNIASSGAGDGTNRAEWRFQSPSAIVRDSAGTLYIADTAHGRVRRISPAGELSTITTKLAAPTSLALDARQRLYVGDRATGSVYRADSNGQMTLFVRNEGRAMTVDAMAFDTDGHLYLADAANHVIRRVTPEGVMTVWAGGGTLAGDGIGLLLKLDKPAGLAFDSEGRLWFTEAGSGRLRRIQRGRVETVSGVELKEPRGLRADAEGNLYVCDAGLHRVLRVAPDGSWLPVAGSGDKGFSGDGEFALAGMLDAPLDVAFDLDGSIFVVDSGNHRIRLLKPESMEPTITPPPEAITLSPISVLHLATGKPQAVAPGQLVHVVGERLAGAAVTVGGMAGTVVGTGPDRLTVQIPQALKPGFVEISAARGKEALGKAALEIAVAAPGILTSAGGRGQALALNEDGRPNGPSAAAERASAVSLFLTGEGLGTPAVTAQIGGYPADVLWAGPAPSLPGVYQVNVRMPGGFAPSGVVDVTLRVNGVATQPGVTLVSR